MKLKQIFLQQGVMIQGTKLRVSYFYILRRRVFADFIRINIVDNAKIFKEEYLKRNVKVTNSLNLQGMRLGINSIVAISNYKEEELKKVCVSFVHPFVNLSIDLFYSSIKSTWQTIKYQIFVCTRSKQ